MKETVETTTNSSVYKKLQTAQIIKDDCLCWYCFVKNDSKYGGENLQRRYLRSWKSFRRTQYKGCDI